MIELMCGTGNVNIELGTWRQLNDGPTVRDGHSAVSIDNKMYIYGGYDGSSRFNDLWEYDPITNSWRRLANGPSGRNSHPAVSINNKMYIFGGYGATIGRLNDLWEYTPSTNRWRQLASGATIRSSHPAVSIDGKMYVFGGVGTNSQGVANQRLNDLWRYNPSTNSWRQLASGATARDGHSAVSIDNKMYIFGGFDSRNRFNDLWEYTP